MKLLKEDDIRFGTGQIRRRAPNRVEVHQPERRGEILGRENAGMEM